MSPGKLGTRHVTPEGEDALGHDGVAPVMPAYLCPVDKVTRVFLARVLKTGETAIILTGPAVDADSEEA